MDFDKPFSTLFWPLLVVMNVKMYESSPVCFFLLFQFPIEPNEQGDQDFVQLPEKKWRFCLTMIQVWCTYLSQIHALKSWDSVISLYNGTEADRYQVSSCHSVQACIQPGMERIWMYEVSTAQQLRNCTKCGKKNVFTIAFSHQKELS